MRKFTITDPIFGATIRLFVGKTEEYNRFYKRLFPHSKDLAMNSDAAFYENKPLPDGTRFRCIWFCDWVNNDEHLGCLTHECQHASEEILRTAGVKRTKGAEEAFTYYTQWLLTECLKRLRKGVT